jgi:hypothetical protein
MSPLELKPMIVILEDKQNDIKQEFFYDRAPVGGKIRAFGSAVKFDYNPRPCVGRPRSMRMPISSPPIRTRTSPSSSTESVDRSPTSGNIEPRPSMAGFSLSQDGRLP